MKYYVIWRDFGITHHYRVNADGEVQHLWRTKWVPCGYACEEELIADGAELGEFDFALN